MADIKPIRYVRNVGNTVGFSELQSGETIAWNDVNHPTFANVATTGSYTDLSNKPTNVSSFANDSAYITLSSLSGGTGVTYNNGTGQISIGQSVASNSNVTFNYGNFTNGIQSSSFLLTGGSGGEGTLFWNNIDKTISLVQGNVTLDLGQETNSHVRNSTGSTIAAGSVVYVSGTYSSTRLSVAKFIANGSIDARLVLGIAEEDIPNNSDGKVTTFGKVTNLNTNAWAAGTILFASASSAGELTSTEPSAPNSKVVIGMVITQNATTGVISVLPRISPKITGLSDVTVTSAVSGEVIKWDGAKWINGNVSASNVTGLATVATTGSYNDLTNKPTIPTNLDSLTDVTITTPSTDQVLKYNGSSWVNGSVGGSGTVTSVNITTGSTGLTATGGPITTSGNIELGGNLKANFRTTVSSTAYSATPTIDWTGVDVMRITLTGNVTSSTFTGAVDGQRLILEITQDANGNRTFAFPSSVRYGTDITSITLTTTGNKTDRIGFIYNSSAAKYDVVAVVKGF